MEILKKVRETLGFKTQNDFANALSLNRSYINRLEKGMRKLNPKIIDKICLTFPRVNREFLETGKGEPLREIKVNEMDREALISLISRNFERLEPACQEIILQSIQRCLDKKNSQSDSQKSSHLPTNTKISRKLA